jgi:hypothetical protein
MYTFFLPFLDKRREMKGTEEDRRKDQTRREENRRNIAYSQINGYLGKISGSCVGGMKKTVFWNVAPCSLAHGTTSQKTVILTYI